MPCLRSSCASARRARPLSDCFERTSIWAYASSSMRPTSVIRSRTFAATSSSQPRWRSFFSSWARLRGAMLSCRRTIARATDSASASGTAVSTSSGGGAQSGRSTTSSEPQPERGLADRRPRRPEPPAPPDRPERPPPRDPPHEPDGPVRSPLRRDPWSEVDRHVRHLGGLVDTRPDAELLLDLLLDLVGEVGVVLEEVASVLLALAELVAVVGVPGTGLADEAVLDAHVDEAALTRDAVAVEDVELGLLERRGDLVLDDLDAGAVADRLGAVLEGLDATHV